MNEEVYGALKRIVEEVKEKRSAKCLMKDCIVNDMIGGNDIDLVEGWIDEVAKEYDEKTQKEAMDYYHKRAEKANDTNLK